MTSRRDYRQSYDHVSRVCTEWWRNLNGLDIETGEVSGPPDRAAIAKLRRIGTVTVDGREEMDTSTQLGYYAVLYARLKGPASAPFRPYLEQDDFAQAVAVVAGTLARVRTATDGTTTAALLGAEREESKRIMQEERFKRLVRTRDWAELHARGRRVVHLLDRTAPVGDLGASLFLWFAGPLVIRDWSLAYYDLDEKSDSVAAATPPASTVTS